MMALEREIEPVDSEREDGKDNPRVDDLADRGKQPLAIDLSPEEL